MSRGARIVNGIEEKEWNKKQHQVTIKSVVLSF